MNLDSCPVCTAIRLDDFEDLLRCIVCGHTFQRSRAITVQYDIHYVSNYLRKPEVAMSHLRTGFLKGFVKNGKLFDVGYGTGAFLRTAGTVGFDAYGCDIHGVDRGIQEKPLISDDEWDAVTFFDSLEHFPDLSVIRQLNRRARLILVSLPKTPRFFPECKKWRHYKPGEHLHYFSEESLARLFHPKECQVISDVEDAVRGKLDGEQNILTAVFS
jgi:hypothetical protein